MKKIFMLLICFCSSTSLVAAWQFNIKLTNIREVQLNNIQSNGTRAITFVGDNASGNPVPCWIDYTGDIGKANLALLLSIKANSGISYISFESAETPTTMSVPTRTLQTQTFVYQHLFFVATE